MALIKLNIDRQLTPVTFTKTVNNMEQVNVSFNGIRYYVTTLDGEYETECSDYQRLKKYLADHDLDINGSILNDVD